MTAGRVRSRRKRRISVRRSKSSLVDKSRSVQSLSVRQTTQKDEGPRLDRRNTTQQRHVRQAESPVRDRRVVTYEEDHPRVARKFVPPKATGVVLGWRSRSCGLTRDGSQRETSSSRYPDAGTGSHQRTRSHESFRSTERGQTPGTPRRNQGDASGSGSGSGGRGTSQEPRRSRYESHRMRNLDIPKTDQVDQDGMVTTLKSDRYGSRRNQGTDLRRSASTRGPYRSEDALNREGFRNTQRVDGMRRDARQTGSMSKIPLARTFNTTTKRQLVGREQSGSGSESDVDLSRTRSRLALRKGHPNESMGDSIDPGTILISNRSLW